MESKIISKVFEQHNIRQRESDGYLSATDMCQAFNTDIAHYTRTKSTKEYLTELESDLHKCRSQLIEIKKGNSSEFEQGTWIHPLVATHLSQWLSPKFAIQVNKWVIRYLSGDLTLVGEVVKNHEQATGGRVTRIDFDYEEKLLRLEQMRNEIAKTKEETDRLRVENTERKRQLLIDMDAFKGDAQIFAVFKNNVMNTFGLTLPPVNEENRLNDITHNKDLSTLYFETTNKHASGGQLSKLGKKVKQEYVRRYNEDPLKASKHVNGAVRDVYVYPPRDYEWIRNIINN